MNPINETILIDTGLVGSRTGERYLAHCKIGMGPEGFDFSADIKREKTHSGRIKCRGGKCDSLPVAVKKLAAAVASRAKSLNAQNGSKVREERRGEVDGHKILISLQTYFLGDDVSLWAE